MDPERFDVITRTLSVPGSRRRALALALAGAMGLSGLLDPEAAVAHDILKTCKKKFGKQKRKCIQKAKAHNATHTSLPTSPPPGGGSSPECTTPQDCPAPNGPCRSATCSGGKCGVANTAAGVSCQNGLFCSGDTCDGSGSCQTGSPPSCDDGIACTTDVCDEASDSCVHTPNHTLCGPNQICDSTQGCICRDGFTRCGGTCYQAGVSCTTGRPGRCGPGTVQCVSGTVQCISNQGPIAETCNGIDDNCDGQVDEGAICPNKVNAQGVCIQGNCTITCDPGFGNCDGNIETGCETNLLTDNANCGACGEKCTVAQCPRDTFPTCVDGNCECF